MTLPPMDSVCHLDVGVEDLLAAQACEHTLHSLRDQPPGAA